MDATAANGQTLSFSVGSSVMVNDATVTMADVATSNGVIHVIDKVLSPTDTPNDIARTAQCAGVHSSLVAALAQAELVETCKEKVLSQSSHLQTSVCRCRNRSCISWTLQREENPLTSYCITLFRCSTGIRCCRMW